MTKDPPESTLTLKSGAILAAIVSVFIALLGWAFGYLSAHETRIAKIETTLEIMLPSLTNKLDEINGQLQEIRKIHYGERSK